MKINRHIVLIIIFALLQSNNSQAGLFPNNTESLSNIVMNRVASGVKKLKIVDPFLRRSIHNNNNNWAKSLVNFVDIDHQNDQGTTFLMEAVKQKGDCLELIKLFIDYDADIDLQDNKGKTALMYALDKCKIGIAEFLLHYRADTNISDHEKKATLMYLIDIFIFYDSLEINDNSLDTLLELMFNKSELNIQDAKGNTTIMRSVCYETPTLVRELITRGADIDLPNNKLKTPLSKALKNENIDFVKKLLAGGALIKEEHINYDCIMPIQDLLTLVDEFDTSPVSEKITDNKILSLLFYRLFNQYRFSHLAHYININDDELKKAIANYSFFKQLVLRWNISDLNPDLASSIIYNQPPEDAQLVNSIEWQAYLYAKKHDARKLARLLRNWASTNTFLKINLDRYLINHIASY